VKNKTKVLEKTYYWLWSEKEIQGPVQFRLYTQEEELVTSVFADTFKKGLELALQEAKELGGEVHHDSLSSALLFSALSLGLPIDDEWEKNLWKTYTT
jgi:hypothetical protein